MGVRYWLMKTEPDVFSWDQLIKAKNQTTPWEGVRNFQARNLMRDEMKLGDQVLFYHSSCAVPGAVGIAAVVRENHPDLTAMNPSSEYFDAKSAKKGASQWAMVSVKAVKKFKTLVSLAAMREMQGLAGMMLLRQGSRLSVQPVTKAEFEIIVKAGST